MKALAICVLLVACGDNIAPQKPDAAIDARAQRDAPGDVAVDAAELDAAPCWAYRYVDCGNEVFELCVPVDGCATATCNNGMNYTYCGPGSP